MLINRLVNRKSQVERKDVAAGTMPPAAMPTPTVAFPAVLQNLASVDVLVAFTLIFVWLGVLAGGAMWLPTQAASWMTFLALVILPGYLLGDLLTPRLGLDQVERLALAFPLGMAVLTLPGLSALLLHSTVDQLALGWAGASGAVVLMWLVVTFRRAWAQAERTPSAPWKLDEIALAALLVVAFAVMLPALTLYKIDGDAYAVNSFAADALAGLPLNKMEPLFGTDLGPGVRMAFNQSLPLAYLWSYWSGIDQIELTAVASRAMIALWSIMAAYMLGRAAGEDLPEPVRGRRFGLLVAAVQVLVFMAAPFLRGDNVSLFFFERTTADKFMVPVTMLPVILALGIHYLRQGSRGAWWGALVATLAVSAIHPLIAAMLALALGAFSGLHLLLNWQRPQQGGRSILLGALIVAAMFLPIVQLVLSRGEEPLAASYPQSLEGWPIGHRLVPALPFINVPTLDVYGPLPDLTQLDASEAMGPTDPFLVWRFAVNMMRRRLLLFDLNAYISDPNILLEPPYLLAFLLLPLLLPGVRRSLGAQLALSVSLAILFVMYNPIITPLIGSLVMPWILWRFVWLLPYALTIALAAAPALAWAARRVGKLSATRAAGLRGQEALLTRYTPLAAVLALALLLSPLIVRNLEAMQERAAFPYFFPTPQRLFNRLTELTATNGAATVMADQDLSVSIPAYVANAHIVAHRVPTTSEVFPATQQDVALQRLIDQAEFFQARYLTAATVEILQRYQVGYVVAPSGSNLEVQMRLASDNFQWIMDDQSYSLYAVRELPMMDGGIGDGGIGASVRGNSALAARQWDEAETHYRTALDANPGDLLALSGMGEIAHARGRFNEALTWYQRALDQSDLAVLHFRLGQLYTQLGQMDAAVAAFDLAQAKSPNVARYHVSMGDACLTMGDETCAGEQYALAAANRNLPDDAAALITLADLWRQRGRTDHALTLYEQAANLLPSEINELMLASAYYEEARYDEAAALLGVLRRRFPLSNDVLTLSAQVQAAQADYEGALGFYRREIWLQELTAQESATTRLALAETLLAASRTTEAQRELERVLTLQPSNAAAHALQGDIYRALQNEHAATMAYQEAFRLDPSQVQLYLALDNQFRQVGGDQTEMLTLLETAMRANPDEPMLALALGDHLQRQGDTVRAIDAYQSALDMFELAALNNNLSLRGNDTNRAYVYTRLAAVSEDLGLTEPAMNYYSAAVAAAPDRAWTQLMYGDALRRRNDVDAAENAYRRAIANDPEFANGYVQLAELMTANGNTVEASVLRQQALDVAFTQAAAPNVTTLVGGLNQAGQADGAVQTFTSDTTAISDATPRTAREQADLLMGELAADGGEFFRVGDGAGVLNLLTRLAQDTGDESRAIELFQQALEQGRREGWYPTLLAQYHKGLGDLYMAQGLPSMAADSYRAAIGLDGWWPQAQLGLAFALESLGQTGLALAQLQSAVAVAPGYVEAQVALADFYEQHGQPDMAMQLYDETAANHQGNPRATLALAQAYQTRQMWEDAERNYRRTIALTPGNSEAYVDLASLLLEQARYLEAEPMLLAALETNQYNMNAHIQMGVLEQQRGNPDLAVDWFKRAVRVRPANQPVNLVLIDLLQRYGHYEMSLGYLAEALQLQPTNLEMVLRQARAQRLLGRNGDALSTLLAAAQMNLTNAQLSAELGELYVAQGRPDAALAAYRQTVALEPNEEAYYIRLAALWRSQADFEQAADILRVGLNKVKQPASLYAAMADLYLQQGMAQDAKLLLDSAISELGSQTPLVVAMGAYFEAQAVQDVAPDDSAELWYAGHLQTHPDDTAVLIALGEHYLRRGMTAEAVASYERAVALTPTATGAHLALAQAYDAANRTVDALAALHQVTTLEPTLADGYLEAAKLLRAAGRPNEAEAMYAVGMKFAPSDGALYIAYCDFLVELGQRERALSLLAQADQVAPTVEMLLARAAVYAKVSQPQLALADLNAAKSKEPGSLDAWLALGDFYRDAGDTQQAQTAYAEATKLSPGIGAGRVRLARLSR